MKEQIVMTESAQSRERLPDGDIVKAVLEGERESYGILIDRYRNLAYHVALHLLKDCDMADDAVQEAFIKGYENLDRLRIPSSFSSWLAGITRNVCRDMLRKRSKTPVSLDYLAEIGTLPGDSEPAMLYDRETIQTLRRLLPRLPEKYREILELRYSEDFSCRKIARFLNLSETAVFSRLFYARKKLLKWLKRESKR